MTQHMLYEVGGGGGPTVLTIDLSVPLILLAAGAFLWWAIRDHRKEKTSKVEVDKTWKDFTTSVLRQHAEHQWMASLLSAKGLLGRDKPGKLYFSMLINDNVEKFYLVDCFKDKQPYIPENLYKGLVFNLPVTGEYMSLSAMKDAARKYLNKIYLRESQVWGTLLDEDNISIVANKGDVAVKVTFYPRHPYVLVTASSLSPNSVHIDKFSQPAGQLADFYAWDIAWVKAWKLHIQNLYRVTQAAIVDDAVDPPAESAAVSQDPPAAVEANETDSPDKEQSEKTQGIFRLDAGHLTDLRDQLNDVLPMTSWEPAAIIASAGSGELCLRLTYKANDRHEHPVNAVFDLSLRQISLRYKGRNALLDLRDLAGFTHDLPEVRKLGLCDSWVADARPVLSAAAIVVYDYLCERAWDLLVHTPDGLAARVTAAEAEKAKTTATASELLEKAAHTIEKLEKTISLQRDLLKHLM